MDTLAAIAKTYNLTIAQVALHWVLQQPGVRAIVSGLTLDRRQMQKNVEAASCKIDPEDLDLLKVRSQSLFKQPGDIYSYGRG